MFAEVCSGGLRFKLDPIERKARSGEGLQQKEKKLCGWFVRGADLE